MDYIRYQNGELFVEGVAVREIAKETGTPVFIYSQGAFAANLRALEAALSQTRHLVCYSVKASSNLALLKIVASLGMGADIVSGGELFRALKAGIPGGRVVFSGVGKTAREMAEALDAGVFMFNLESHEEMELLGDIAARAGAVAHVAFRVNPDVDPRTHPYIATGLKESKFGIPYGEAARLYGEAKKIPSLKIIGLDCHIGSQLTDVAPFQEAARLLGELMGELKGQGIAIRYLDVGGGLGIAYESETPPTAAAYVAALTSATAKFPDLTLILEPGRSIVGNACLLATEVLYNKETDAKNFVVVDAGMNDLIRPSLYGARHAIFPARENVGEGPLKKVSVVGPVCESGDFLAQDRLLPPLRAGEYLAVMGAGAYGFSMSSNYNSRARAAEVLASGEDFQVIRRRESYEDLIRGEIY
ncbi:MAG: diaminopimelate decarboxylase [Deltaproteobacteria bacterium]|nr:diaminopimelate decarboxylase [Deltaproteobacteria bacterium]